MANSKPYFRFTFEEKPMSTINQKPKSGKGTTKLDNIAGVMYEACRKSKIKSPRFKAGFVATIPASKNYGKTVHALMHHYRNHGELKCACCGGDNVYFRFHKEKGRVTFKAYISTNGTEQLMTVDHDMLKSLGGPDTVANYNPMCYRCNQIRGSRFAEFKEFKDWYDSKEVIDTVTGLPNANFCFIDYALNKNNNQFFSNVVGSEALPPQLVEAMMKAMRTSSPDPFAYISIKEMLALDRNYANKLLNELVYERSFKVQNCRDVPMGEHDFFIGCQSTDHRKIKIYIEEHVKAQLRKRMALQQTIRNVRGREANEAKAAKKEVQEATTSFTLQSLWIKFTSIFA